MDTTLHGFTTRAIHVGQAPDPATGATIVPIYATSTYTQESLGHHKGFEYGRGDNPTRLALETALASLEHGQHAFAFASGIAACDVVVRLLPAQSHIIAGHDLYGGVYRLFQQVHHDNHRVTYVDLSDSVQLINAIRSDTKILWVETPTNPLLQVYDIEKLAEVAHAAGLLVVVDNTFASPYLQNPLRHGADIVVHSTTKYIGGHSDVLGGAIVVNDDQLANRIKFLQNAAGAIIGPFEAWLTLRGLKTLALRMERHTVNAMKIAEFLQEHPRVRQVYYPGLSKGEAREILARQMKGFGGMISFELGGDADHALETARTVLARFRLFSLAESLGGVESLVGHPATMTHAAIPRAVRESRGIRDGLIRLSVGIEDVEDLLADIAQALGGDH
ncbi:MAG: cystathionine gamma-synthase [Sulfobacillus benefaciens]|uniref:Cystathionine gamma-synthase n=1 Tax=Sulfobacillus benefaciens TaxID=453960 RepID=A0A2T2XCG2_9FIRM|nr:MAG: cystathionine gamma-synthase [Sulfobacillus benefaciens]